MEKSTTKEKQYRQEGKSMRLSSAFAMMFMFQSERYKLILCDYVRCYEEYVIWLFMKTYTSYILQMSDKCALKTTN